MTSPAETNVCSATIKPTPLSLSTAQTDRTFSKDFRYLPIPRRLRYDLDKPFHFGMLLNVSFGIVVANLYYCQPILIQLSASFHVSYDEVARIPTLVQAGFGIGLLFIAPLGDMLRRRQLIMLLIVFSTVLTIGLAITNNLLVFEIISFLIGLTSITPQIVIPLAADLAPPARRGSAISVVLSGFLLGILLARVLSGIVANFTSWRIVYFTSIGIQCFVLGGAYLLLPDYPVQDRELSYFGIFRSMARYAITEPLVGQIMLINWAASACYTNWWVTLTFLLGGPPYNYSTMVIGLFGLVGMLGVIVMPFVGRLVDRLVPWWSAIVSTILLLVFQAVQTGAGGTNIAAVIISCFGLDLFRQTQSVSLSTLLFSLSETARSRLNALMIISIFLGQITGTSVGTHVFVEYGWRADSALFIAMYVFQFAVFILRGPHCPGNRWFGYEGGFELWHKLPSRQTITNNDPESAGSTLAVVSSEKKDAEGKVAEGFC
ncbi:major facilitator superfamily domain-containing protein [Suillus clintonianus]|uniref:major facilitator superfamily domain-containing protein n=1 Tax=Suillus clintonianus TaxID=1904413 RepID=UPI001B883631|nr:major facilitator superfamily domain-containing protein [Suillus clintonianus]KAG2124590.1 major facilitator superfamily domain-containing protein [Suillus clintonianus]